MKHLFVTIIATFLTFGCVSTQQTSYVFDGEIFPVVNPIYPEHKQCKMDYFYETWLQQGASKFWCHTDVSKIKGSLFVKSNISKIIFGGRTFRSITPFLVSISSFTDMQGAVKKTKCETIGLNQFFPAEYKNPAKFWGLIISDTIHRETTILNKGPLKISDALFLKKEGWPNFIIDGYSYYKNKKVLVVSVNETIDGVHFTGYGLICPKTFYALKLNIIGKKNGQIIFKDIMNQTLI